MAQPSSTGAVPGAATRAAPDQPDGATAALVLADGSVFWGRGGATGEAVGEVCFNTSMTGYQEIITDPSYAGQIITFTFPHIGNVGTNDEDIETITPAARGVVLREDITDPANWRAARHLDAWLKSHNLPGVCGIDTRQVTRRIRDGGAPNGVVAHRPDGRFDVPALVKKRPTGRASRHGPRARGQHAPELRLGRAGGTLGTGYGKQTDPNHVVAVDYGAKRNILRCLANAGCKVTVVPATATAEDILRHKPDGVFLSNGPAIRPRPASMPCRRSRACSTRRCRCSASAWATRCWRWRSAARPLRWCAAIAAPTSR